MYQNKSLNCCSCGAGLSRPSGDTAKCHYCGNYNKILPNGDTLIYKKEEEAGSETKFSDLTLKQKFLIVAIYAVVPLIVHRFYRKARW